MYFKKVTIPESDSKSIEKNIRLLSLKRNTSLDFKSASTYVSEPDKLFLGFENDYKIDLLRITSPFEKLLPKIIVNFEKVDFKKYRLKLKFTSIIPFGVLTIALILNFFYYFKYSHLVSDLIKVLMLNIIFYVLLYIEYRITTRKLNRLINWSEKKTGANNS